MKQIALLFCLVFFTSSAFGQQLLWSTIKSPHAEYIPLDKVTGEVLEFYDHYKFYFDGTGYSKDGFFKTMESSSYNFPKLEGWNDLRELIYEIDDLTVFAFKSNTGYGSVVLVVCVNKKNVNLLIFSNNYDQGANLIFSPEREKFEKWFKTLLH